MINLKSTYLGLELPHPLVVGASPMVKDVGRIRQMEDAGAAAVVMHSLFEEQLTTEQLATSEAIDATAGQHAEALSYFPEPPEFSVGPHEYLELIARLKAALDIPVVASLNGTTLGGWLEHARLMAEAGADAIELNLYMLATDPTETGPSIEDRAVLMVREVKKHVAVPVAVKLQPFWTSLPNLAARLCSEAGADALVLFNRFYQPDIDPEELQVTRLHLSDRSELLLRLHWLAILSGNVSASLAVTGGVHSALDVVKAVMCGADAVQLVSAIYRHGPQHLWRLRTELAQWLIEHEYESLEQMRGSMNLRRAPDPSAYLRANYMQVLQSRGSRGPIQW